MKRDTTPLNHSDVWFLAWAVGEAQSLRGIYEDPSDRANFQTNIDTAKAALTKLRRELRAQKP